MGDRDGPCKGVNMAVSTRAIAGTAVTAVIDYIVGGYCELVLTCVLPLVSSII